MENGSPENLPKRLKLGMEEKDREVNEKEEQLEGSLVVSDEMEANISQILENIDRFTQMVTELMEAGKAMFKELSNDFEERLLMVHKEKIEKWKEEIRELRLLDGANEEINAVLLNATYLFHNPNLDS
ncbi:unnamed protein product [Linum tenue]|uniref:Knotted 1-binding protein 36 n=1 Tax=Linum tenue TaxID=586396 RepID=A0AAV0MKW5_9ROSI|nr:unnamed protein product [Linum tenue]